ncbi:MAG: helix-turn-helix domain-containing protein [Bdellovibrionales bacterium]|nr:helix-turn-helix domain-containing protein [Bdellovibrionales bacterium]
MKTELNKAEYIWRELLAMEDIQEHLPPEALGFITPSIPKEGWLKYCREAQHLGLEQIAQILEISKAGLKKLETNEATGVITLRRLQEVAKALDCELIYFIRPRQKKTFSSLIWQQILPKALKTYRRRSSSRRFQNIQPAALARVAQELFRDPQVRREMQWVRNRDS